MNPLTQADPGLYIWALVVFGALALALAKFAWRPLLAALETRQEAIRKSLDDAAQADELFSVLMGEDVDARRSFITRNAKDVRFLDI